MSDDAIRARARELVPNGSSALWEPYVYGGEEGTYCVECARGGVEQELRAHVDCGGSLDDTDGAVTFWPDHEPSEAVTYCYHCRGSFCSYCGADVDLARDGMPVGWAECPNCRTTSVYVDGRGYGSVWKVSDVEVWSSATGTIPIVGSLPMIGERLWYATIPKAGEERIVGVFGRRETDAYEALSYELDDDDDETIGSMSRPDPERLVYTLVD